MFELIKGDEDNLEGKVIVYAKAKTQTEEHIVATYATTDLLAFLEEFGIPTDQGKPLSELIKNMEKQVREKGANMMTMLTLPIEIGSETDLMVKNNDIIYTGEFTNSAFCMRSIDLAAELYMIAHKNQMLKKAGTTQNGGKQEINWQNFKGNMKEYILRTYVAPILDAKRYGENKRVQELATQLANFAKGAHYENDSLELCRILQAEKPNLALIDAYLTKIEAICAEDYKTAARKRDEIKELLRQ